MMMIHTQYSVVCTCRCSLQAGAQRYSLVSNGLQGISKRDELEHLKKVNSNP